MMPPPHNFYYYATPSSFGSIFRQLCSDIVLSGVDADTGHWQAKTGTPMSQSRELQYTTVVMEVPATPGALASMIEPNVEWAEEHFQERVGGKPLNPPPSHVNWPYAQKGNEEHTDGAGAFSHSYPERLWPKKASSSIRAQEEGVDPLPIEGIRYQYGDLDDAVNLLVKHPHTRQCYVPLWFPEDLYAAAVEEERVPCTLGYHFMVREDKLHCFYPMRSCDLLRYFKDDAYMAGRLLQWMLEQVTVRSPKDEHGKSSWNLVQAGQLMMVISSLHVFAGDMPNLQKRYGPKEKRHAHRP